MNNKDWRPIEEAPHEKKVLLGYWVEWPKEEWAVEIGYASHGESRYIPGLRGRVSTYGRHGRATHFQYLPNPPTPEAA